jgi:hypothetical protein
VLAGYEIWLALAARRRPERLARSAHASLREDWFHALSAHKGSEILAVQTLRNSVMAATLTATTAVLGLMGTLTLAAPSLRATLGAGPMPEATPGLVLMMVLLAMLFGSLFASAMAVRYYNHASFIAALPVDSSARAHWTPAGVHYLRRAGVLYSWGLRQMTLIAPVVAALVQPWAGPVAAVLVVLVMVGFDRAGGTEAP